MYNLCCLRIIYANYSNSKTKKNDFFNSYQTYKQNVTGKD
jgi:hypothetical protein